MQETGGVERFVRDVVIDPERNAMIQGAHLLAWVYIVNL